MNKGQTCVPASRLGYVPVLTIAAFVAAGLCFTRSIFNDPDSYWHLASGDWVLRHRMVPRADPFSSSFAGHPWSAHEWVAEVLMALAFRAAEWRGVAVLTGLAAGAALAVIGVYLRKRLPVRVSLLFMVFVVFGMAPSLPGDRLIPAPDRLPGWRRLYADRYAVVHVRSIEGPR